MRSIVKSKSSTDQRAADGAIAPMETPAVRGRQRDRRRPDTETHRSKKFYHFYTKEPTPMKILIAEDEVMILKAVEFRLKKDGYEVITCTDGREALAKIDSEQPDIVISDIMMPFANGLEIITHVKKSERPVPVIILSAVGLEKTILEAFDLGADDFITKPFSPNELSMRVKRMLAK